MTNKEKYTGAAIGIIIGTIKGITEGETSTYVEKTIN